VWATETKEFLDETVLELEERVGACTLLMGGMSS
jgi:hypothetical protein